MTSHRQPDKAKWVAIAIADNKPEITEMKIAVRMLTTAIRPIASNGPAIAPRLSIARSNP